MMSDRQPDLRIEAVMIDQKPDLMPWARYILEDMLKEKEERNATNQAGTAARIPG